MVFWDGDRCLPGRWMILCGDKTDIGGGGVGSVGGFHPWKYIGRQEEMAGRVKSSYGTISDGA